MTKKAIPGTVSEATLRAQDLIPKFLAVLKECDRGAFHRLSADLPFHDYHRYDESIWWESEDCSFLMSDLFAALDEVAPDGYWFGAHPDDGACYGFWKNDEERSGDE